MSNIHYNFRFCILQVPIGHPIQQQVLKAGYQQYELEHQQTQEPFSAKQVQLETHCAILGQSVQQVDPCIQAPGEHFEHDVEQAFWHSLQTEAQLSQKQQSFLSKQYVSEGFNSQHISLNQYCLNKQVTEQYVTITELPLIFSRPKVFIDYSHTSTHFQFKLSLNYGQHYLIHSLFFKYDLGLQLKHQFEFGPEHVLHLQLQLQQLNPSQYAPTSGISSQHLLFKEYQKV
ncbi:unnamed protein product [Paramecium pentaurelia]|uniref:Uncharacterized protein n=1 Tax=Paramecium pentaurelia TaxID=43138 RepID=A0A8S1S1N1_9CILI|nr:unnamed protein product [Paramecium pentaurelia]